MTMMSSCLRNSFCGSYETVKYVHIPDARLGCLRFTLLIGIALYVVVFEMIFMGGYLDSSIVVGVVRFSLQQPTVENCDPYNDSTCHNAFAPLDTLEYCTQKAARAQHKDDILTTDDDYKGNVYPCQIYEAVNAQIVQETSLTVITRASTKNETLVCSGEHSMTCDRTYQQSDDDAKFYTAQSEAFTILMDHAVTAAKICQQQQSNDITHRPRHYACSAEASKHQGRLFTRNAELCLQEYRNNNSFASFRGEDRVAAAPCYIQPNRTAVHGQDFFALNVLLRAAGVTLDDCAETEPATSSRENLKCETYRETGATLLVNIFWSDFVPFQGKVDPYYYYSTELIGTSFKQTIPYYTKYRQTRTVLNAHGIRVAVLLGGEFNQFQIVNFLITLTTALGLLAVATTIVDSLMLYVLPEKKRYHQAKYEVSGPEHVVTSAQGSFLALLHPNSGTDDASPPPQDHSSAAARAIEIASRTQAQDTTSAAVEQQLLGSSSPNELHQPLLGRTDGADNGLA